MVKKARIDQINGLEIALIREGICLREFLTHWDEVILFGSRAIACASTSSDWDLLCIGLAPERYRKRFSKWLDIVVIDSGDRASWGRFLCSELAHHTAEYGCWIKGTGEWVNKITPQLAAIDIKARRIIVRCRTLTSNWSALRSSYRGKWRTLIRRDVQRLLLLLKDEPIPPSILLDDACKDDDALIDQALPVLREANCGEVADQLIQFRLQTA